MIYMRRRIISRTTHCSGMTHQHADATWTQQLQTRRTRRPDVRSPQGRVLLKRKTSTCATESVSYDIAIERSTPRTSKRANERASRQSTVEALCLPYSDWGSMWYSCWRSYQLIKRINALSLLSLIKVIIILGRSPWCRPGIYFPAPTSRWRTSPSEHAHHPPFPTIERLRPGSFIIIHNNIYNI